MVEYQGGPRLSYSLNAHSPWEGYRVAINGTEGRAELEVVERAAVTSSTVTGAPTPTTAHGDADSD